MISLCFLAVAESVEIKGIFSKVYDDKIIMIDVSGSSRQHINGSSVLTKPEYAIYPWNKEYDWCSNCYYQYSSHPWISFSLKGKKFKINGYFIRCGCCYTRCCCEDEKYGCFDCCTYSWALQISDDNQTWTDAHKIEKDESMKRCNEKSYDLGKTYTAKYVRLIQLQPCPGYPPAISINRFELFGEVVSDDSLNEENFVSYHDDDEDVSIIGHISKNGNVQLN